MDRNKKTLLQEIRTLLRGPQPSRSIVFFEGEYHLSETLKGTLTTEIITQDQAKTILNEDMDCKAHFIYLPHKLRANQIEPDIPAEIKERINPPDGIIIGVSGRKCAEGLIELFLGIPNTRVAAKGNSYYSSKKGDQMPSGATYTRIEWE